MFLLQPTYSTHFVHSHFRPSSMSLLLLHPYFTERSGNVPARRRTVTDSHTNVRFLRVITKNKQSIGFSQILQRKLGARVIQYLPYTRLQNVMCKASSSRKVVIFFSPLFFYFTIRNNYLHHTQITRENCKEYDTTV